MNESAAASFARQSFSRERAIMGDCHFLAFLIAGVAANYQIRRVVRAAVRHPPQMINRLSEGVNLKELQPVNILTRWFNNFFILYSAEP